MSTTRQKNSAELMLRGLAVIAVVVVHFLAGLPGVIYTSLPWQPLTVFLDQVSRISVPLFVALSGYGLSLKYQQSEFRWPEFLRKRVFKLVPLYVLWSLVFFAVFWFQPAWRPDNTPSIFWLQLLLGKSDYHLYFVPMIFQLYLLFPLLRFGYQKQPWLMLGGALVFQLALFALFSQKSLLPANDSLLNSDQEQYLLCISWIFYFVLGMHLAHNKVKAGRRKMLAVVVLAAGVAGLLWASYVGFQQIHAGLDPIVALRFTRWPVLVYASCLVTILIWYTKQVSAVANRLIPGLAWIGTHSYAIYLSHTLWLRILFLII